MLKTVRTDGVAEIHMDRPPANALDTELVTGLLAAHAGACTDDARAIILTGRPGMFSGGLDVPALLPLDRGGIHEFWLAFFRLTLALAGGPAFLFRLLAGSGNSQN